MTPTKRTFENISEGGERASSKQFLCPTVFSTLSKANLICAAFYLLSANAFKLYLLFLFVCLLMGLKKKKKLWLKKGQNYFLQHKVAYNKEDICLKLTISLE